MVGMQLAESTGTISLIEKLGVQIDGDGTINAGSTSLLQNFNEADNQWAAIHGARLGDSDDTRRLRSAAAGDIDGDGFEEVIIVYVDTSAADRVLRLRVIDDLAAGFAHAEDSLGDGDDILDVSVATGDFNGDGTAQIAIALGFADRAELRILEGSVGSYAFDDGRTFRTSSISRRAPSLRPNSRAETLTSTTLTSLASSSTNSLVSEGHPARRARQRSTSTTMPTRGSRNWPRGRYRDEMEPWSTPS